MKKILRVSCRAYGGLNSTSIRILLLTIQPNPNAKHYNSPLLGYKHLNPPHPAAFRALSCVTPRGARSGSPLPTTGLLRLCSHRLSLLEEAHHAGLLPAGLGGRLFRLAAAAGLCSSAAAPARRPFGGAVFQAAASFLGLLRVRRGGGSRLVGLRRLQRLLSVCARNESRFSVRWVYARAHIIVVSLFVLLSLVLVLLLLSAH